MPWTIVVPKRRNGVGEQLDTPRWRSERMAVWIGPVGGKQNRRLLWYGQLDMTGFPKDVEIGQVDMMPGGLLTGAVIEMPQPLHLRAALGELRLEPKSIGEGAVDVVLRLRLTYRFDGFLHDEVEAIARCPADIIAFQRRGTGQHDIGPPRRWRPPGLVNNDGFRPLPGAQETVES